MSEPKTAYSMPGAIKPRYFVMSIPNVIAGERYQVRDGAHGNITIAELYNITHCEGDHLVIDEAIGWQNAQTMCQILNVTEEASRVQ